MNTMGVTKNVFQFILSAMTLKSGRLITKEGKLGLALHYLNSTMKQKTLSATLLSQRSPRESSNGSQNSSGSNCSISNST